MKTSNDDDDVMIGNSFTVYEKSQVGNDVQCMVLAMKRSCEVSQPERRSGAVIPK